ncbi:competence/damage-inducible protein A [Halostella sp. JP-L12]|uniref:competence/damage-inducible protein A n=1 Tax=Halostella TaxID=1843185 RepID=UPI000EF764E5|nr:MULTISPECIES: competence/damage-inducible protein A [Halostella]NHN47331.1 competence/damage-inducible protein A [Halostella sp. JP-L12]
MDVAILTVGDEILAGDTTNTNASWLAAEIADRGSRVRRILTVPDDRALIAEYVADWRSAFDAVLVTGGLGGTPDDVTMEAVADAVGREMVVYEDERERLVEKARRFREENPEMTDEYDLDLDVDAAASLPADARSLSTNAGWVPGCVVENVYVFPGFPDEMRAMFGLVAEEFVGDAVSEVVWTPTPEGALGDVIDGVDERFDVAVGSYPGKGETPGRLKVSGTDPDDVDDAVDWIREHLDVVDDPGSSLQQDD